MPNRNSVSDFLHKLPRIVFETTGFPLNALLKLGAILAITVVGIVWTVLYTDAKPVGDVSEVEILESKRLTSEEQFLEVSQFPSDYAEKQSVEKIGIVKSKIKAGEALARSGGHYSERANDQLVLLYGTLCKLQDLEGIDSQKAYGRLAELRQQAFAADNEARVATADFLRAVSATSRLKRRSERTDFRFATDAVLNLRSRNLANVEQIKELYFDAIELHDTSTEQDSTAIFLSILADKLLDSPERAISNLGLSLKDHAKYARYYAAVEDKPYSTGESKIKFFNVLFEEIEKAPPQSPRTYQVIVQLVDRLLNKSDADFAGTLTKRLGKAASMISPKIKADVDLSIKNIETRIAALGKTIDLSGSKSDGSPLQLPNGKPTTLVFWKFGNLESMEHVQSIANSERFDSFETNVLMAGLSSLNEEQFEKAEDIIGRFTILDNATSNRLGLEFGIDLVPYQVSLDKDGKVIRLGESKN